MKTYTNISRNILFILITCLSAMAVFGEGTKQVAPGSSDVVALLVNYDTYGNFARFNSSDFERLYIRIQDPSVDRIYLGFSRASSLPGETPGTTAYFRVRRPDGTVVFGPEVIDNTHEIESYTEAVTGPDGINGVTTAGYTPYIYDPSGNPAGDYWVEFLTSSGQTSQNSTSLFFNWFDITVANGTSSVPGRVWSKRWALALPDANTNFNGAFYVFAPEIGGTTPVGPFQKAGYVSKIDFTGSGFRPWYFNVAFNGTGPGTSGNVTNDRKSVSGLAMAPSYEVFLTEPDVNIWENGSFGSVTGQVTTTRCGERSICLNVTVTQTGDLEALIDANPPGSPDGIYTPGTADRVIAYNVTPVPGESPPFTRCVPWDGLDGLGNVVGTVGVVPVVISYSQAAFHFPVFDVEENQNGWNVISVRPTPPSGFQLKFYWDDSNISYSSNTGSPKVNLTGCTPATPPGASGCHTWDLFDDGNNNTPQYGNMNTINTWWYLQRTAIPVAVTIPDYIVPIGPPDAIIDPYITVSEPLDGSFVYHLGGDFEDNDETWWETLGSGTFSPDNTGVETDYTPSPADIVAGSVKIVMHIGGRCDNPTDTATLSFVYPIDAALSVTQHGNEQGPVHIIYTVTLNRPNNTGVPITFDFDDPGTGTATSGSDYTAISPTAKISVGQGATTGTFTVTVINDALCETTETVNAVISNPSGTRINAISTPGATGNILDNENGSAGGTASASPSPICSGNISVITVTGYSGSIQWQQSSDGSTGWANVTGGSGATSPAYTTPALTATTYYRARVTSGSCPSDNSTVAHVTVDQPSYGGTALAAASPICTGSNTTVTVSGYNGTIQWMQSANGSTGWANVTGGSGATTPTYTTPNLTATTWYRALVTNGVCSSMGSDSVQVRVDQLSVGGTANASPSVICSGATSIITVSGYTGSIQWEQSPNGSTSWANVSGGSGATTASYTTPALTAATWYRAKVTFGTCNPAYSTTASVTINPKSVGGSATVAVSPICTGSSTTVTVSGYTGTIQWQQSADGSTGWANVTGGSGSTSPAYTTPNLTATTWYRAMVTSGVCSPMGSDSVQVRVDQLSIGGTANASPYVICSGGTSIIIVTGYTGSIQWEQSPNGSTGWVNVSGGSGATTSTYTTPTLTATTWYRAKVTFGTCNPAYSTTATVTVDPVSAGGSVTGGTTICIGSPSGLLTLSGHTGKVVKWQSSVSPFSAWTDISDTTTTYTSGALTQTTQFRAVVQSGVCPAANSTTTTVTVDNIPPTAICKSITIQLNSAGSATIVASDVNNGSSDNCGIKSLSIDKTDFTCSNVGANTVVLTVTDTNNNSATCSSTVTVQDKVVPVANCKSIIVQLDATGNATIAEDAVNNGSTDACGGLTFATSKTSFTCANQGTNTVTLTVTDKNGNSSTCSSTVTVQDKIAPLISKCAVTRNIEGCNTTAITGPAYSATTAASTEAVFENATNQGSANDPCGITSVAYIDVASGTCPVIVTRKWTLSDASGNTSACNQTINVDDTTPPTFTRPPDITINRDAACQYDVGISKTGDVTNEADNCGTMQATFKDEVISSGKCSIVIARTWSLADNCGNSAADQVQTITVMDGTPPVLQTNNICVYLSDYGLWALNEKDISDLKVGTTDNCSAFNDLIFDISPRSFDCADIGSPVKVKVTAQDLCGNIGTGYSYVLVKDTIRPVALCKDTTVYLDKFNQAFVVPGAINRSNDWQSIPIWGKTFIGLKGGSYDNCAIIEMEINKQLFTGVDVGKNPVTLTVWDPSRNFRTCNAVVTVIDTITSILLPVSNITMTVPPGVCSTKITYPEIKVKGSSPVTIEKITGLGANGNFPLGTTLETWKATEQSGKITFASFTVTIQTYNAAPTINGVADIVVDEDAPAFEVPLSGMGYGIDCAAQQIVYLEVANSNPSLLSVTQEYVNGAASGKLRIIPLPDKNGVATITLTLKDNGGITNGGVDVTVKTFRITVTAVNDPPTVKTIPNQYVIIPASLSVNVASAFIDADEGDVLTIKVTKPDGTALPSWMTFNPSTGLLTGTPTGANLGLTEVQILGTDKAGASIQEIFLVVVSDPDIATLKITAAKGTTQLTGGFTVNLYVKDGVLFNPVLNTPVFSGGTYTFYNLPVGTYFAEAVITDAILNPGLMNTYYESSASLTGAVQITLSAAETKSIQISMVSTTLNYGPNRILGKVIRRNGIPDPKVPPAGPGTPASGINLVLKYNGSIVATAITGADGKYVFDKLSPGNYEVAVELAGYTQDAIRKVSVYDDIQDSKADFTIWVSDNSHVITKITEVENPFEAVLYPNPTTGKVNIDLTRNGIRRVDVSVYNILGVQVFRNQYSAGDLITFDMSDKVTGIYMVKIEAEGRIIVKKLTLERR